MGSGPVGRVPLPDLWNTAELIANKFGTLLVTGWWGAVHKPVGGARSPFRTCGARSLVRSLFAQKGVLVIIMG